MSLQELGSLGELVGGIAVIVSLLYLAFQIRQNTKTSRASNYESVLNGLRQFHTLIAQDGELADIYMRGSADLSSLNPKEFVRFNMTLYNVFTNFGVALHLHQQGMIEDRLLQDFEDGLISILAQPGVLAWWKTDDAKLHMNWRYLEQRRAAQQAVAADQQQLG